MSLRIGLCFCHGWGFDPSFWSPLLPSFSDYPCKLWNLGYDGELLLPLPDSSADRWIAVGHSLGFRKLMESKFHWGGAVAVQGFYDFLGSEPRMRKIRQRFLDRMRQNWKENPGQTVQHFYETCALSQSSFLKNPPVLKRIESDLNSLAVPGNFSWPLTIPHRVLGSRNDLVVSAALMESEWASGKIEWSETAGHTLGFFESDFVAESIHSLIREVRENRHL